MTFAADSVSATPFRGGSATLNPPLGHSKARERKSFFISKKHLIHRYRVPPFSLRLGHARVLTALGLSFIPLAPLRYPLEKALYPLFLLQKPPQKKKLSKRKAPKEDFALCGARQGRLALDLGTFPKRCTKTSIWRAKTLMRSTKTLLLCAKILRRRMKSKKAEVIRLFLHILF